MAIAINASGIDTTGSVGTNSITWSFTVNTGVDVLAVAVCFGRASGGAINSSFTGATWNGSTMTLAKQQTEDPMSTNRYGSMAIYYIVSPDSGTHDLVASTSEATPALHMVAYYWELTGADTSTVVDTTAGSTLGSGAISCQPVTGSANSLILGAAFVADIVSTSNATWTWDAATEDNETQVSYHTSSFAHLATTTAGTYDLDSTNSGGTSGFIIAVGFLEESGGTAHSVSATGNLAVSDSSASVSVARKISASDSIAVSDGTISASVARKVSASDALALGDSASTLSMARPLSAADGLTTATSGALTKSLTVSASSALTIGESAAIVATYGASASDALALTDNAALSAVRSVSGTSALAFSESAVATKSGGKDVSATSGLTFAASGGISVALAASASAAMTLESLASLSTGGDLSATTSLTFASFGSIFTFVAMGGVGVPAHSRTNAVSSVYGAARGASSISLVKRYSP